MTIRDPEVLEALGEEPELLAIADAVTETQRFPRPTHRRVLTRAAAIAAVGATALVAVLLWPGGGGGGHGILDRALAAIGDGRVLHLVVRMPTGAELVDIQSGRTTVPSYEVETWSDRNSTRYHVIFRLDGRIVGEALYPQDGGSTPPFKVNPAYTALWTGYRQALADGNAKIDRAGTLYGHRVYWLTFPALGNGPAKSEVAIDRSTYRPLDFRVRLAGGRQLDNRILLAQTEPFSAAAFTRRTSRPNPALGVTSHSSGVVVAPAGPVKVTKPWLRAGPAIAGVKLSAIRRTQTTSGGKTSTGFELVYGSETAPRRSLIVGEMRGPGDASEWNGIPRGFVRVTAGEEAEGNGSTYAVWSGYFIRGGVYVSIQTGLGKAALLEAARTLRAA
jgi:hypothetical protein